jgi:molybdate/tungstate transport system ATP-binding protein
MISVRNLCVSNGHFRLENVAFEIPTGGYGVLMGKTGSGKSTLLEAICGLKPISSGSIILAEREAANLKPSQRGIGYVPQDGALFSTMTVHEHLAFALRIRRWENKIIEERVRELACVLGIESLLPRRPQGLSGGEAQRVALGRALAFHPSVLLLDEPLSALDEETRYAMYGLLRSIRSRYQFTALHVTHSGSEAKELADMIFVLKDGRIAESSWAGKSHSARDRVQSDAYPCDYIPTNTVHIAMKDDV